MSGDYRGGPGPIPKRWLRCPRKSNCLIDQKFLAFKTPLDPKFDEQVPPECRFTPEMLLASMKTYKTTLGFWIDLTNTKRYYNSDRLSSSGIKYLKLDCRGHDEAPTTEQTQAFIRLCSTYIAQNPLKIVGVHCTHGFNRTGFLIVSYLVEQRDWALDRALFEFSRCRPPGIYKQDYLEELHRRYGDPGDPITPAPPRPDWCYEDDEVQAGPRVNGESSSSHAGVPGEPEKSQSSKFMEGIRGVVQIMRQPTLKQIQAKAQALAKWRKKEGFPGSQPVSMDRNNIGKLAEGPYMVSWKADGTRYMMLIDGVDQVYLLDRDNCVFQVPNLRFPKRKDLNGHLTDTLVDGEMVLDKVGNQTVPRFLLYDIVKFQGVDVGGTEFGTRLICIRREIIEPRALAIQKGRIHKNLEPFSVRIKEFYDLSVTAHLLSDKFRETLAHEPDGLIFQPKDEPYTAGRCDNVLKWKPHYLNSVDFKLKVEKKAHVDGMLPEKKGLLYVGGMNEPFAEIPLTKELEKLNNQIIECHFDAEKNCWSFMRVRTDKSFPNGKTTAYSVCNTIQFPITEQYLLDFISQYGWKKPAPVKEKPVRPNPSDVGRSHERPSDDGHFAVPTPPKMARR